MRREDNIGKREVSLYFSDRGQQSSHFYFNRIYLTIYPTNILKSMLQ